MAAELPLEGDGRVGEEVDANPRVEVDSPATIVNSGAGAGAGAGTGAGGNEAAARPTSNTPSDDDNDKDADENNGKSSIADGKKEEEGVEEDICKREPWRLSLALGQFVDMLDTMNIWSDAQVVEVGSHDVLIHYTYWTSKWDERVAKSSPRLAPYGSHIYIVGGTLRVGQQIDVFDDYPTIRSWTEGTVINVTEDQIRVHFKGFTSRFDKDFAKNSHMIAPFGTHTKRRHIYRPVSQSYWHNRKRKRYISQQDPRLRHYRDALSRKGLSVHPMIGDGNCLFRSVSHQIYGSQDHHAIVRARCCDYMEKEAQWFAAFVVGERAGFMEYLADKRKDGEWGDDPEIQAMCELYDRRATIFVYDPSSGARVLRRFHESSSSTLPPIRLSYYGGGHYDSVVGADTSTHYLTSAPGERERRVLSSTARSTIGEERKQNLASTEGDSALRRALLQSREDFDNEGRNLEAAMLMSMNVTPTSGIGGVPADDATAAMQASLAEEARRKAEDDALQRALEQSLQPQETEDEAMQRALALSMAPSDPDAALAAALRASMDAPPDEDTALAVAMAASMGTADPPAHAASEDDALAAALRASMAIEDPSASGAGIGEQTPAAAVAAPGPSQPDATGAPSQAGFADAPQPGAHMTEEEMLQLALALSADS